MKRIQADEIKEHMNDGSIKAMLNHARYISLVRNSFILMQLGARGKDRTGSRTRSDVSSSRSTESLRDPTTHRSTNYISAYKFTLANPLPPLLTARELPIHWTFRKLPL